MCRNKRARLPAEVLEAALQSLFSEMASGKPFDYVGGKRPAKIKEEFKHPAEGGDRAEPLRQNESY